MKSDRPQTVTRSRRWSPRKVMSSMRASNSLVYRPAVGATATRSGRIDRVVASPATHGAIRSARTSSPPTSTSQISSSTAATRPVRRLFSPMKRATNERVGSSYRASGEAICSMRPARKTATRSDSTIASCWSWVTYRTVTPRSRWIRRISYCSSSRRRRSSAPSGSSIRTRFGSNTSARAIATRCCWPPESWRGRRCSRPSSRTSCRACRTRSRRRSGSSPRTCSGKARFSPTVMCGNSA